MTDYSDEKPKRLASKIMVFIAIGTIAACAATIIETNKTVLRQSITIDSLDTIHQRDTAIINNLGRQIGWINKTLESGAMGKDTVYYQGPNKVNYIINFKRK
jgi:hypothetical protein